MVLIAMTVRDIKALLHALADDRSCKSSFHILFFFLVWLPSPDGASRHAAVTRALALSLQRRGSEEKPSPGRGFQGSRAQEIPPHGLAASKILGIPIKQSQAVLESCSRTALNVGIIFHSFLQEQVWHRCKPQPHEPAGAEHRASASWSRKRCLP